MLIFASLAAGASGAERHKPARAEPFAFAEAPRITRDGDRITIDFSVQAACDVTIAIENETGRIVRHLASGLLGPSAPAPYEKGTLRQTVVWDGKDDRGRYIDAKDACTVRVSLGLKPGFEKNLNWDPRKRASYKSPIVKAAPEGVYVFDSGQSIDHLRLFDHDGNYLRTVYPFPAGMVDKVEGLIWRTFEDGQRLPVKPNFHQCTLLMSGDNCEPLCYVDGAYRAGRHDKAIANHGRFGTAAYEMAVRNGRMALISKRCLNRLSQDGSSGGLPLNGPLMALVNPKGFMAAPAPNVKERALGLSHYAITHLIPKRATFSPDGEWLYLTRYEETQPRLNSPIIYGYWQHAVYRMRYAGDSPPELFLGDPDPGGDAKHFCMPADVACDKEGTIYVADYLNDRVQVFTPDGALMHSIAPVPNPAEVCIHERTGDVYVFSWPLTIPSKLQTDKKAKLKTDLVLSRYSPKNFRLQARYGLPIGAGKTGMNHRAEVDSWSRPTRIWLVPCGSENVHDTEFGVMEGGGIGLLVEEDGKLALKVNFDEEVRKKLARTVAPTYNRQRLYVNPNNEKLYVAEGQSPAGATRFDELLEIDPHSGAIRPVKLPLAAEELCFDLDGHIYLRTSGSHTLVARYDFETFREVPFDYGDEFKSVPGSADSSQPVKDVISAIYLPDSGGWQSGGIHVSPKGHLAVHCNYHLKSLTDRREDKRLVASGGKPFTARLYPGRITSLGWWGGGFVHVFDPRGKLLREDWIKGLPIVQGLAIDREDCLYTMLSATRTVHGDLSYNFLSGSLVKFGGLGGKLISAQGGARGGDDGVRIVLQPEESPGRPHDFTGVNGHKGLWAEGAEWIYGGAGWFGKNDGVGCNCWNSRFALDLFARSFVPEIDRYSLAVLDSAGNRIARIGTYGNVDSSGPESLVPLGGDEVGLMHAPYLATHTDRRLYVSDPGNGRILSVKLGYHAEARVRLAEVKDPADDGVEPSFGKHFRVLEPKGNTNGPDR